MDDGSAVPATVKIQVVCNGTARTVTQTTSVNDFSFQWNASPPSGQTSGASTAFAEIGAVSDAGSRVERMTDDPRQACDLRAEVGGYTSTEVHLSNRLDLDGSDVGVIFLHRIAGDEGRIVSISTLQAPKDARKNFDKGTDLLHAGKLPEAATCFEKAVTIYPRYAEAWLSLGRIQFTTGRRDAALESMQRAKDLDDKLVGAWQVMGYIAAGRQDWENAAHYLDEAVRLDPADSPLPWFFSAFAHYQLQGFEEAERSIRAEIKLDPQFRIKRAQFLLALILIARQDTVGGAAVLHNYLAASPDPRDVDNAKTILSRLQPVAAK
jgi:tetratricopeptide (TPR) repeat protein